MAQKPKWVEVGEALIGTTEIPGRKSNKAIIDMVAFICGAFPQIAGNVSWYDNDDIPWCGLFQAYMMAKAGIRPPAQMLRALAWAEWGVDAGEAKLGATAVKKRKGGGHVGTVVAVSPSGKSVLILGGNQGNRVSKLWYPTSTFFAFRAPAGVLLEKAPVLNPNGPKASTEA